VMAEGPEKEQVEGYVQRIVDVIRKELA
jgi:hypothetical protein